MSTPIRPIVSTSCGPPESILVTRPSLQARAIAVTEAAVRRHAVADPLLDQLGVDRRTVSAPRPDRLAVHPHLEHAAGAGDERHLAQLLLEGRQHLLRQPRGARQEPAAGAVFDFDSRFHEAIVADTPSTVWRCSPS